MSRVPIKIPFRVVVARIFTYSTLSGGGGGGAILLAPAMMRREGKAFLRILIKIRNFISLSTFSLLSIT